MLMRRETARMTGAASAVLGGTFLVAAFAHATDGFTETMTRAAPASVLGIVTGIALLVAGFGLLSNRLWGWRVGVGAHVLAIATLLFGLISLSQGYGDGRANLALPGVMLALVVLSFFALWRARPRNPIRRAQHKIAARLY